MLFSVTYLENERESKVVKLPPSSVGLTAQDDVEKLDLARLRDALRKRGLMSADDCFSSKGGIVDPESEGDLAVGEIFPQETGNEVRQICVQLAKPRSSENLPAKISLKLSYEGNARPSASLALEPAKFVGHTAGTKTVTLAAVRAELQVRSLMGEDDRFIVEGSAFEVDSESAESLDAAFPQADGCLYNVVIRSDDTKLKPGNNYTVKRNWDEKSFSIKLKPSTLLSTMRISLTWMDKKDVFVASNSAEIALIDEDQWTIGETASEEGVISVYRKTWKPSGKPAELKPAPQINLEHTDPGYKIGSEAGKGEFESSLGDIEKALRGVEVEKFDDFKQLQASKQRALVVKLDLLKGICFAIDGDTTEAMRSALTPVQYHPGNGVPLARQPSRSKTGFKTATVHRVINELRHSSVYATSANGSIGMDGLGDLALDVSYRNEKEKYAHSEYSTAWVQCSVVVNKIVIDFDRSTELQPHPMLLEAVQSVLKRGQNVTTYQGLHEEVFGRFGYFLSTEVAIGGRFGKSAQVEFKKNSETETELNSFNIGLSGTADLQSYGKYGAGASVGGTESKSESNTISNTLTKSSYLIIGGDENTAPTFEDDSAWSASLKSVSRWAVIDMRRFLPVLDLLPEPQKQACVSLIVNFSHPSIDRTYTPINMRMLANKNLSKVLDKLI